MVSLEDDINSGAVTSRLTQRGKLELIARVHAGLHTHSLRMQLREARAALALALASKRHDGI